MNNRNFWRSKNVLLTGGTGFVGGNLIKKLLEYNCNIFCIIRNDNPQSFLSIENLNKEIRTIKGDIIDKDLIYNTITEQHIDIIFHLAAQVEVGVGLTNPYLTFETNIRGTYNLLEACRLAKNSGQEILSIIVASSDKAYGTQPVLPYTEDMSMNGDHPYEVSKSCTDLISTTYARTYGTPVTIARCGNIYGGGDLNWNRIVPGTFRSLLRGEQPVLRSDGTFIRDYLHVDDIVSAYLALGEQTDKPEFAGQGFNFSDESPLTVMQIYKAICTAAEKPETTPNILNAASSEIKDQYLDSTKAHEVLGWHASVSLGDGLKKSFDWYRELLTGKK